MSENDNTFIDIDQIKIYWACVNPENKNHVYQNFFKKDKKTSGIIHANTVSEVIDYCIKFSYWGLNCLSVNPIEKSKHDKTGVTAIENLYFDMDVSKDRRNNGISSDEDKQHANDIARKCVQKLEELGFTVSLYIDSGNGFHIYVSVNIPLNGENKDDDTWDNSEIKGKLITVEKEIQKFGDDVVNIDCISKDIFRRVKIPGTLNVKPGISEENYKMCQIIEYTLPVDEIIKKNTEAFNKLQSIKDKVITTGDIPNNIEVILKTNEVFCDLYTGKWEKYCYNEDGTKKKKWSRSEAEFKLIIMMFSKYKFKEMQVRDVMESCQIGKWQKDGKKYQDITIRKAKRYLKIPTEPEEIRKGMEEFTEREAQKIKEKNLSEGDRDVGDDGDVDFNIDKSKIIEKFFASKEEREKLKILHDPSGFIFVNQKQVMYNIVFSCKDGIYHPLVVFDNNDIVDVRDKYQELLRQGFDKKEISKHERYQYFVYGGVKYKFSFHVSWNYKYDFKRVNEDGIENLINGVDIGKDVLDRLQYNLTNYWNYPEILEYWIVCSHVVLSYIDRIIGQTFFLVPFGKMGSGKSTLIIWLSNVSKNGFYSGKISIASSVRFIERYGITLCYDEFEKKSKEEKLEFIGVTNNSYTKEGIYVVQKQNSKNDEDDTNVFKTFCTKSFTANSFFGFDGSFIDRCHCIVAVKNAVPVKNIHRLSNSELQEFQTLRNELFIYCVRNWQSVLQSMNEVKETLDAEGRFGREGDMFSFIVGIIQHFKGEALASKVKQYLQEKTKVEVEEKTRTIEEAILELLVEECEKNQSQIITILNKTIHEVVCSKLSVGEDEEKKISYQKIKRVVASLNLIPKKSNMSSEQGGALKFLILKNDLLNCIRREGYKNLENRMLNLSSPSSTSSPSPTKKQKLSHNESSPYSPDETKLKFILKEEKEQRVLRQTQTLDNLIQEIVNTTYQLYGEYNDEKISCIIYWRLKEKKEELPYEDINQLVLKTISFIEDEINIKE